MNIQPIKSNQNFSGISVEGSIQNLTKRAQRRITSVLGDAKIAQLAENYDIYLQPAKKSLVVNVRDLSSKDDIRSAKILKNMTVKAIKEAINYLAEHNSARITK